MAIGRSEGRSLPAFGAHDDASKASSTAAALGVVERLSIARIAMALGKAAAIAMPQLMRG